jgi:hypothetical protein
MRIDINNVRRREDSSMGYDFEGADGCEWGTTSVGWWLARHLAERFGWRPAGPQPPEDWDTERPWSGEYTGNSGQRVTALDAAGLAAGLRAAVASPAFDSLVTAFGAAFRGQLAAASTATITLTADPFPPDEWRQALQEFAAFCERGAFSIH